VSRGRAAAARTGHRPILTIVPSQPLLAEALRLTLNDAVVRLEAHDPGAREGEEEAVHQMRVAVRRLRSDLLTLGDAVDPGWSAIVEPPMRSVAAALGAARDLDVLVAWLRVDLVHNPALGVDVRDRLERQRSRAHATLHEMLIDRRYADLRGELDAAAAMPPLGPSATRPAEAALTARVLDAWRRLARRADALGPASADADFHRVRLAAKRCRYAADLTARVLSGDRAAGADRLAEKVATLQGVLGELQDAVTAERALAEAITDRAAPGEAYEIGRLAERARARADLARRECLEVWPSVRRRKWRKWAT
jgi:CHAD domain-containing protein